VNGQKTRLVTNQMMVPQGADCRSDTTSKNPGSQGLATQAAEIKQRKQLRLDVAEGIYKTCQTKIIVSVNLIFAHEDISMQ
jgi:hypothetical protein